MQSGFYLEVDPFPGKKNVYLELSFIDSSSEYNRTLNSPIQRINRHRLEIHYKNYIEAQRDPNYPHVFILYDEKSYFYSGLLIIKEIGWCSSSYRPAPGEIICVVSLHYLLALDDQIKRFDV